MYQDDFYLIDIIKSTDQLALDNNADKNQFRSLENKSGNVNLTRVEHDVVNYT